MTRPPSGLGRSGGPDAAADRDRRKRQGVFYTPEPVATYLARSTLSSLGGEGRSLTPVRVLDPACGAGALLWAAYRVLCERAHVTSASERLQVLKQQLFGVDLDAEALARLRQKFRDDLASGVDQIELEVTLKANFRCGNALTGGIGTGVSEVERPVAVDWNEAFPEVLAAGGFDVVLANPPYRRERGAKEDLSELEALLWPGRWRAARMDLWHYFWHRSLDLLQPGGLLTFIVNSYWTTSRAGGPLIQRMREEATPLEFVLLDTAPVFDGVGGRHLTMQLRKGITGEPCQVFQLAADCRGRVTDPAVWDQLFAQRQCAAAEPVASAFGRTVMTREQLFAGGRLRLKSRLLTDRAGTGRPRLEVRWRTAGRLGDLFEVRQGIAENPPRVTRQQAAEHPEYRAGEGVFVLTADELQSLNLAAAEQQLVRPYYAAADIEREWLPDISGKWLLYLTRQTAPDLERLPQIAAHLSRFRPLLERRREVLQGKIAWWHLHWPREARLFEAPRVLAVQMGEVPRFAYVERPAYVGFAVNLIVSRTTDTGRTVEPVLPLSGLAAVLNSRYAAQWFAEHAKQRGVNLDITGGTLKEFPVPQIPDTAELVRLAAVRRERLQAVRNGRGVMAEVERVELAIDALLNDAARC